MKKQREKTEQGIERRVEKNRMEKIESKKEHRKKHRKRGEIKNRGRIAVVCTINKICAGEIPQETQVKNRKYSIAEIPIIPQTLDINN